MRRQDRAVTAPEKIAEILARANVCRIALHGGTYPYIVPMNYGFTFENGAFTLYLHCAKEGEKLDWMRKNPHVSFEVDGGHTLQGSGSACSYTMKYESVIGQGELTEITDADSKRAGMAILMHHLVPGEAFTFPDAAIDNVAVLRLDVHALTGKTNITE